MQILYEIPIIPNNLREDETIVQIADILTYLQEVFDDIILRINTRLEENKNKIFSLNKRIHTTSEKIMKLTGTKKATQIFSSSKYPASEVHKKYKCIFVNTNNKLNFKRTKAKFKNLELTEQPLEKLQFYHVKMSDKYKQNSNYIEFEIGLGRFPNDIESVTELLLYNTSKNPYKNYVVADPLHAFPYVKHTDEVILSGPDAAPLSISQRAANNRLVGENYFYSPDLGDVPSIDVPVDLPDLPGVADDLRYIMESGPTIAPSVTTTPILSELPSIIQPSNESFAQETNSEEQISSIPLPALPSDTPETQSIQINIRKTEPPVTTKNESIEQQQQHVSKSNTQQLPESMLPVIGDARANLMEAIRKAGGAKKANLRMAEQKKEEKSFAGGNNLMADLHAKLALRRKGISGTNTGKGYEVNSALNSVSAMIPPPPVGSELNESTNTEDDEWDE